MSEEKRGFFGRLREKLSRTRESFVANVRGLFAGHSVIDDDLLEKLEQVLIQGDIGVDTTMSIIEDMRKLAREQRVTNPDEFVTLLKEELITILTPGDHTLKWKSEDGPHVTLIAGVNGSG